MFVCLSTCLSRFVIRNSAFHIWLALLLAAQAGCIPHYSDFVGAQDSRADQVGDAGATDGRSGDGGGEVVEPDIADTDQQECIDDVCICKPDCTGKKCGYDGCESTCGSCETDHYCDEGTCKLKCGDGQCGAGEDQCNCPGDCTGGCAGCCAGTMCKVGTSNGECGKNGAACTACSGGKTCQSQACAYKCGDGVCADVGGETQCTCPEDCESGCACCDGEECVDVATDAQCGKDAEACAACTGQDKCVGGTCVCQPACGGKICGPDGCGATCGTCQEGWQCDEGQCVDSATPVWTDPTTGFEWQNPPYDGTKSWSSAKQYCADLSLDGGGWHLPTIGELRTLIRGCPATEAGGSCNVEEGDCLAWSCRDDSCGGCSGGDGPAGGCYWPDSIIGSCSWYWSSSPVEYVGYGAWRVYFNGGGVHYSNVSHAKHVRCLR